MVYVTKDPSGLIQLWNSKPKFNFDAKIYQGWLVQGEQNEVAIDVTANRTFRNLFNEYGAPCCLEVFLKSKIV